jgi:hypothetical protein
VNLRRRTGKKRLALKKVLENRPKAGFPLFAFTVSGYRGSGG